MGILEQKKIVLLNYPLGLSLLKYRNVWVFWNKKNPVQTRATPLNSNIDKLVQVKNVFLLDYPLVFFLLKPRSVGVFWNKKNLVQTGAAS